MTGGIESRGNEVFKPVSKTGNLVVEKFDNTLSKKAQNKEILDSEISKILDILDIPNSKQDKLIERILKYSDNKELFNNILEKIKKSFDEDEVSLILDETEINKNETEINKNETEKESDKTEKESDKTEKESDKTEKESDKTEKESDKTEKESDKTEKESDKLDINEKEQFLKKINSLIPLNGKHKESYGDIIELLKLGNIESYPEIIKLLKNPGKLTSIVDDLGGINSTKYTEFKNALILTDSSFRDYFDPIEVGVISYKAKALLGVSKLNYNTNLGLNTLSNKTDDGFNITANRGGLRNLSLEGSEYDLNASFDNSNEVKEINIIEGELKEETVSINNTLKSISVLLKYIDQAIIGGTKLSDIKNTLKLNNLELYNKLGIDSVSSISDIKQKLSGFYKEKEKEKKEIIIKKRKKLDKIISDIDKKSNDTDKIKKETLRFIHSIGFDMIPQSITDSIISQLNSNDSLRNSLGFQNDINLEEGNLGTNIDHKLLKINNAEKVVFAKFVNVMISGYKTGPIDIDTISGGTGSPIKDRYEFKDKLIDFQKSAGVGFAMNNIKSSFKQENNKN